MKDIIKRVVMSLRGYTRVQLIDEKMGTSEWVYINKRDFERTIEEALRGQQ